MTCPPGHPWCQVDAGRHWPTREALLSTIGDSSTKPSDLTFALEVAGRLPSNEAVALLLPFLGHPDSSVREGAICGLCWHAERDDVRPALEACAATDPSPGIRVSAKDALE
jgi:HEAT repeat protein